MNIPESFIAVAKCNTIKNISLGYDEIYIFEIDNIEKGQIGYSIDEEGNKLTTEDERSWNSNWLVIGYSENTGDPFFIDISSKDFPVFTSMHGEEIWDPTLIADTYLNFIEILTRLHQLSLGRETPVEFESNPIPTEEIEEIISEIEVKNRESEVWYWENFLEQ